MTANVKSCWYAGDDVSYSVQCAVRDTPSVISPESALGPGRVQCRGELDYCAVFHGLSSFMADICCVDVLN